MPAIALSKLQPDPRNANVCSPETLDKLQRHLARTQLCPPLIVRPHPAEKGVYQIIDGHHRFQVVLALGWKTVPCQIWDISETETQLALATLNRLRGTDLPSKRAELVQGLLDTFTPQTLSELLPETEADIQDLLSLLQLETEHLAARLKAEALQEQAQLPVTFSFLMPADQGRVVEQALSQAHPHRGEALFRVCHSYLEAFPHDD